MNGVIIGGGIAGLTSAIALEKAGVNCQIFEAASEIHEVGAGIWMAPNAMQVFDQLGLADEICESGMSLKQIKLVDPQFRPIQTISQQGVREKFGFSIISIHRAALQQILLNALKTTQVFTGKSFTNFETGADKITAVFENGSIVESDFLLGADGLHSAVRRKLFPNAQLRDSAQTCWRGVADFELSEELKKTSVEIWGGRHRFGFAEIAENTVYWYAVKSAPKQNPEIKTSPFVMLKASFLNFFSGIQGAFIPEEPKKFLRNDNHEQSSASLKNDLVAFFHDFKSPVPELIAETPQEKIIQSELCDLKPLPAWSHGRVCLLGDAAHATTPNMGQGGAQAVEDAFVLGELFKNFKDPRDVFPQFETIRFAKANRIVRDSRRIGQIAHLQHGQFLRNALFRLASPKITQKRFENLYRLDSV